MNREEQISNANPYAGSSDIGFGKMVGFNAGAEWADKHPASPWISVKERLPEKDGTRVWVKGFAYSVLWHRGGKFYSALEGGYEISISGITHWMYIPEV